MPKRSSKKSNLQSQTQPEMNQVSDNIMNQVTSPDSTFDQKVSLIMAEMGRRGGLKGGKRRAEVLTAKERKKIAQDAARARWAKK